VVEVKNPQFNSIWKQIILAKYNCHSPRLHISPIWREITALTSIGKIGRNMIVNNGMSTRFWLDRWYTECALSSSYHALFYLCEQPDISVFEVIMSGGQALTFRRQLHGILLIDYNNIGSIINNCTLSL
jgi:hypothetical protein